MNKEIIDVLNQAKAVMHLAIRNRLFASDVIDLSTKIDQLINDLQNHHKTPAAMWRESGEPDPHGTTYECERHELTFGNLTDDELANAVFLHGNSHPHPAEILAGTAFSGITYLTAAKERIRWLSRALCKAEAVITQLQLNSKES
jgi:hypothetical protein